MATRPPEASVGARPGDAIDLSVSVVTYAPDLELLRQVLRHLDAAVVHAQGQGLLGRAELFLVDNGPGRPLREALGDSAAFSRLCPALDRVELLDDHGNPGFGGGHNLALARARGHRYLVLNPDALLAPDALSQGLDFMTDHPQAGLLAPSVRDGQGRVQYLCKRYPSVLDLLLRGFAPGFVRRRFRARLARYEMQDCIADRVVWDVPLLSGCCLLARRPLLDRLGGFSPAFFLYFEDYDLSLRAASLARTVYVPRMRIVHYGGQAARKGWHHIGLFLRSAIIFFHRHGWRWW